MGFKFFQHEKDEFERMLELHFPGGAPEGLDDDFPGLPQYDPELHGPQDAVIFLSLNVNRDNISDEQYQHILRQQRTALIERMWQQGDITHTIVSQDDNGFTLRTEVIRF